MATGRDLRARLVLLLNDRASPGLDRVPGRLDRIRNALRRISIAAAVVGGLSMLGPLQQAAEFEDTLRQNAITAGETGAAVEEMIRRTQGAYERLARATGQRSRDIAQAAASLIAAGLDDGVIQRLLPIIARVATGTNATLEDLGQTALQLRQQLGITIEQMPQAFASLIQAGRDGNFELRDMAQQFPSILAAARSLGMQGPQALAALASALQVARQAAGTSSEAANNVLNMLQKMASPEVGRNFREIGVNLEGVMQDAARRGINPMEALIQKLRERTGGNLFRLQEIFADRQALMGILPLIQQTERYLEIRDRAAGARTGIIDEAFADRMRGARMQLTAFVERLEQLHRRFILLAGTALRPVNDALDRLFDWIDRIDAAMPGMIDQTASWALGGIALAAALGLVGQALSFLGAGLTLLLTPLRLVFIGIAAIVGIKVALIIAAIAAIAGAAYLIWRYWDRIGPWFRALWETIKGWFTGFVDWLTGWASAAYGGAVRLIQGAWLVLSTWFDTLWNTWVRAPFEAFVTWVDGWTDGAATAVVEKIKAGWEGLKTWFADFWAGVTKIFTDAWGPILAAIERIERFFARRGEGAAFQPAAQGERGQRMNAMGAQRIPDSEWNAPEDGAAGGRGNWTGRIVLELPPGVVAREANTNDPRVSISPDRGATRSRP